MGQHFQPKDAAPSTVVGVAEEKSKTGVLKDTGTGGEIR